MVGGRLLSEGMVALVTTMRRGPRPRSCGACDACEPSGPGREEERATTTVASSRGGGGGGGEFKKKVKKKKRARELDEEVLGP